MASLIDISFLDDLRDLVPEKQKKAFLKELVDLFESIMCENLDLIKDSLKSDNLDSVARIAHKVKSSCSSLGIVSMSQRAVVLEQIRSKNDITDVLSELERDFKLVKVELRDYLIQSMSSQ